MAIVVAYGVAATIATILQCNPLSRAWDKTVPGTCFDIIAFWYANASYTIATDLILLVLPMRVIWGLQLGALQKVAVLMVFAMGGLVTVFSIIRTIRLVESATSTDPTYDIESTSWANIEANIAILCACLPIFRRPLVLVFPKLFSVLGDHPTPERQTEDRTFSYIETDKNRWASDCPKMDEAPHDTTGSMGIGAATTRNGGSDEFVLEHVDDVKVALC